MREKAGEISLCGKVREKRAKCGSLPPNAGGLATMVKSVEDSLLLQKDINSLESWSTTWLLKFNIDKCHVLSMGKIDNIMHTHRYQLYKEELDHVFEEKDLGVVIDMGLTFEEHISTKIKKANEIMGLIRRTFSFLDIETFKTLYTSFVRPHFANQYGLRTYVSI